MYPRARLGSIVVLLLILFATGCKSEAESSARATEEEPQTNQTEEVAEAPDATEPPGPHAELLAELNEGVPPEEVIDLVGHYELHGQELDRFRLQNDLEIILLREDFAPVIAYQTWLRAGSRHEPEGKEGLAHLLEHLMFRRTTNLKEGEYDREMEQYGIDPSASTWLDYTYYYQKIPADKLDHVARLEAERLSNLEVIDDVFEAERDVVLRERHFRIDNNPQGSMLEQLYHAAFPHHPYRHPTTGYSESLAGITAEDCQWFYDHFYGPNNAAIVLVGDLELGPSLRVLRKYYAHMEPVDVPEDNAREDPMPARRNSQMFAMPVDAEMMVFGFPAPSLDDPDSEPYQVLNEAMFASPHGRLYRQLKLEKEQVTALEGWVPWFKDRALYEVFVSLRPGVQHEETRRIILDTLAGLRAEPLSETELSRARNRVELDHLEMLQDVSALAEGLGHYWAITGEPEDFLTRIDRVRAVTAEDIQRLAATWFRPPLLTEVLVLPKENLE